MFNKSMWKRLKDQSGMVLPMVLMLMVLALCIVVPGLSATGSMVKVNHDLENSTKAYYAAKAGIEDVCWRFKNSLPPENLTVNNMNVTISESKPHTESVSTTTTPTATITTTVMTYFMQSTARLKDSDIPKATIYTEIKKKVVGTVVTGGNGYPFDYAIATTGGELKVDSNSLVKSKPADGSADVFANGRLDVDGSVHGKGYYTTTGEGCNNIQYGCEISTTRSFQTLDESWYQEQAGTSSPPLSSDGTYKIDNKTVYLGGPGNISYINGNLDIKSGGKVILQGVVWVNGWITSRSNSSISTDPAYPDKQYYLLAHGNAGDEHNISIGSNTSINANNNLNLLSDNGTITLNSNVGEEGDLALLGIIYAPNGAVRFDSNSWASVGAVLGKSVELHSNSLVNYNTALGDNPPEGFEINVTPETTETTVTIERFSG